MTNNTPEQEVIRKLKSEYQRKWRKQNPDKVKAIQEKYWLRKAREVMEAANQRVGLIWEGESGPEIVNLPQGTKITPNHKSGQQEAANG